MLREAVNEASALKDAAQKAQEQLSRVQTDCDTRVAGIAAEAAAAVTDAQDRWRVEYDKRRKLHNQVGHFKSQRGKCQQLVRHGLGAMT